jgi:hypothetical protein
MRRRIYLVRFYGTRGGRLYSHVRIAFFIGVLVLSAIGFGLLLCEPYVKKEMPKDVFEPIHIIVAVDISKSMLAPATGDSYLPPPVHGVGSDSPCAPTRLAVAAHEVMSFVHLLARRNSDKLALVLFARYAYPAIPVLSDDYQLFRRRFEKEMLLENVLTMAEGSNHWYAVERSLPMFKPDEPYKKLLIILTDGEPYAPEQVIAKSREEALDALRRFENIAVYIVGVGEPSMRVPIPFVWRPDGCPEEEKGYIVQTAGSGKGKVLTTKTDPEALRALAEELGGEYVHSFTGFDLAEKLLEIIDRERRKIGVRYETAYVDLSGHLLTGLLLFMAALVIIKTP